MGHQGGAHHARGAVYHPAAAVATSGYRGGHYYGGQYYGHEEGLPWWMWLLFLSACLLCAMLFAALYCCLSRSSKRNQYARVSTRAPNEDLSYVVEEVQPAVPQVGSTVVTD